MIKSHEAAVGLAGAVIDLAFDDLVGRPGTHRDEAVMFFEDQGLLEMYCALAGRDTLDTYNRYRAVVGKTKVRTLASEGSAVPVGMRDGGKRVRVLLCGTPVGGALELAAVVARHHITLCEAYRLLEEGTSNDEGLALRWAT